MCGKHLRLALRREPGATNPPAIVAASVPAATAWSHSQVSRAVSSSGRSASPAARAFAFANV